MTETALLDLQKEVAELQAVKAESIGWLPLGDGAYLHVGGPDIKEAGANRVRVGDVEEVVDVIDVVDVVDVVGVPDVSMVGMTVLLLAW